MDHQNQQTILLVEDEMLTAMYTTYRLQSFGYEVVMAHSGEDAVKMAADEKINLILMDIDLGSEIDGTEAAEQILAVRHIPIVFLTAHTEEEYVSRVKEITRYGYVIKNSGDFVLKSSIEMAFELFKEHEKTRQSEVKYRTLFESAKDAIFIADGETGIILDANTQAEKIIGRQKNEIIGMPQTKLHPEVQEKQAKESFKDDVARKGKTIYKEFQVIHKDGHTIPVEISPSTVEIEGRLCVYGIFRDITDRKKAQEVLRESETRYKNLLEGIHDSVYVLDRNWKHVIVNQAAEKFTGIPKEELIGGSLLDLFPGVENTAFFKVFQNVMETRKPNVVVNAFDFADGRKGWYEVSVYPVPEGILCISRDITDRKKAESKIQQQNEEIQTQNEELRANNKELIETNQRLIELMEKLEESEEKYRMVVETSEDLIFSVDTEGNFMFTNRSFKKVLGYTTEDIYKINGFQLIHPDDVEDVKVIFQDLFNGKSVIGLSYRYRHKDGHYVHLLTNGVPFFDDNGHLIGSFGISRDMTKQKQAEATLKENEEKYRFLAEKTSDLIVLYKPDGTFSYISPKIKELTGYSVEEYEAFGPYDNIYPDDRGIVTNVMDKIQAGMSQLTVEYRIMKKTGEIIWIQSRTKVIRDKDNRIEYFLTTSNDITDRKQAEAALKDSEERFRAIFEQSAAGIATALPGGKIKDVNPKLCDILGYTKEELLGLTVKDITDPEDLKKESNNMQKVLAKNMKYVDLEKRYIHKNGHRIWCNLSSNIVTDKKGEIKFVIGVVVDITDRKQAEAALKDSEERFRAIFEQAAAGMAVANTDDRMIDVNQKLCDMLGYTKEELLRVTVKDISYPNDMENEINYVQEVLEGKRDDFNIEKRFIHKNGHPVWANASSNVVRDENGDIKFAIGVVVDMTERKKAEKALKESEERLNLILKASKDIILMQDPQGKYLYYNGPSSYGLTLEDVIGKTPYDFHDRKTAEMMLSQIQQVIKTGKSFVVENKTDWHGETLWFLDEIHPVFDSDGNIIATTLFSKNITERKKVEEILKMYELITAIINDPMSFVDTNYIYRTVNDAYTRFSDRPKEKIINHSVAEILGRDIFEQQIKPHLDRCFGGEMVHYQLWVDSPAKGRRYMDMRYYPLFAEDGTVRGAVSQGYDMTTERMLQEKLQAAEKDWRDSFNSLNDVMMIITKDFVVENINQNGLDLLGLSKDDVVGRKCYEVFHQGKQPIGICPFLKTLKNQNAESAEWYSEKFGRYFSVKTSPVFDEHGEVVKFVDLMRDITETKQAEKELREANETKDKFFGIIAHDLKNPVNVFGNGLKMLNEHVQDSDDETIKQLSEALYDKSKQLLELLDNLLEWSQLQRGEISYEPQNIDLFYTAYSTIKLLEANAQQKNITLTCNISEGMFVYADYHMVDTIFRNLITNAIKFTNCGGQIVVEAEEKGDFMEVAVIDNGVGMSEDKMRRLFKVGERNISSVDTDGKKGTGLGLILCEEFVEKHGGSIWVESKKGKGSTFRFTLPK